MRTPEATQASEDLRATVDQLRAAIARLATKGDRHG